MLNKTERIVKAKTKDTHLSTPVAALANKINMFSDTEQKTTQSKEKDVMDAQIEMSNALTTNKILYYLANLPIQLSLGMMKPKLKSVAMEARFIDYLSAWL